MILSMTGFAARQLKLPHGILSIELRAVNHRYLDLQLRLPEELRIMEARFRETFTGKVLRGKVECRMNISPSESATPSLSVNHSLLNQLLILSDTIKKKAPDAIDFNMMELLRWPGILISPSLTNDALQEQIIHLLQVTIDDFSASRNREGEKLAAFIQTRLAKIEGLLDIIRPRLPKAVADYEEKLKQRLLDALQIPDNDRIRQEIILFAQRIDVEEELGRLLAHSEEVRRILKSKEPSVGKRLDFLMQELNREANTLGSKSTCIDTSQAAIELKVLIEQMREQVQNIE